MLPSGPPFERRPLAALVVMARLLRRESWREYRHGKLRWLRKTYGMAPPARPRRQGQYAALSRIVHTELCQRCEPKRWRDPDAEPCGNCLADAEVDLVVDSMHSMREVYVPTELNSAPALFSFEAALESLVPKRPPETLRCMDLQPQDVGGAYRAAMRKKQPTFHGHGFGDTIKLAREGVDRFMLRGMVMVHETRAYAWPLLWLRYGSPHAPKDVVLMTDGQGRLRAFLGTPPA